ncbi:MAG: hypothetical protein H7Y20_18030 [Bryobacteraceae bacterium]|nr:hypothetical protein [Bryobacteraceae bacterium]
MNECSYREEVAEYAGGDVALTEDLRAHLVDCGECQALLLGLEEDRRLLQAEPAISAADLDVVRSAVLRRRVEPRKYWGAAVAAGVVVATLLGAGSLGVFAPRTPEMAYTPPVPLAPRVAEKAVTPLPTEKVRRPSRKANSDELMASLAVLLEPPSTAPATSDAPVVVTMSTADPDVVIILLADSKGEVDE